MTPSLIRGRGALGAKISRLSLALEWGWERVGQISGLSVKTSSAQKISRVGIGGLLYPGLAKNYIDWRCTLNKMGTRKKLCAAYIMTWITLHPYNSIL